MKTTVSDRNVFWENIFERVPWKKIEHVLFLAGLTMVAVYLWQEKIIFNEWFASIMAWCGSMSAWFNTIPDFQATPFLWFPLLSMISIVLLGILIYRYPPRWFRAFIIGVIFSVHTVYILFRVFGTLNLATHINALLSIVVLLAEVVTYFCLIALYIQLLWPVDRRKQADILSRAIAERGQYPSVDVFIPTCSEPIAILRRTVIGCQALEYPKKTIYMLDDGNRGEVKALADTLGCEYRARVKNIHAKAGNLNHALKHSCGELIAVFDADCIPTRNFLSRTVGFFQSDNVGLVTAGQYFYNYATVSHNVVSLSELSPFFMQTQMGKDTFNATLCYGTCFVVRRAALDCVGGIPTETLSEDWALSIKLQAAGYKTYFLNEILAAGAAAESIGEFVQQRLRWTRGTLQALFAPTNPFFIKGLNFWQRLIHCYGIFYYLSFLSYFIFLSVPLLYFFFGLSPMHTTFIHVLVFFFPNFFLNLVIFSWLCKRYTTRITACVFENFMSFPLLVEAVLTLLQPFGVPFRVTRKGIRRKTMEYNKLFASPLAVFACLYIIGLLYGAHNMYWDYDKDLFYIYLVWTFFTLVVPLCLGIQGAIDLPQERHSERFPYELACEFTIAGKPVHARTINLSDTGALVKLCGSPNTACGTVTGLFSIPELCIAPMPARIIRNHESSSAAVEFLDISIENHRRLVEFLYCRPEHWMDKILSDRNTMKMVWRSALRFVPLKNIRQN
ncbi:MAG: glycosyltransferase [Candidatus Omnitrophica bacterium]|nr:glycosyltransferase [Candidatus Omnitrophota bacterium]